MATADRSADDVNTDPLDEQDSIKFSTVINEGHVEEIFNIGKAGDVTVERNKSFYLLRDVKQLATLLFILFLGAGVTVTVFSYIRWYLQQPVEMDGDFNIAVAQFGEITNDGIVASATATQIGNRLFNFLDSEYKSDDFGLEVQVSHRNIPIILEDLQAEQVAEAINADLLIYGNIFIEGNVATFEPRFFVSAQPDTGEITGQSRLEYPILFQLPLLSTGETVNQELRTRAAILASFTRGLAFLTAKDYSAASRALQQAIEVAEAYGEFDGKEVLYLVNGTAKSLQDDFSGAEESYRMALRINPEYARAYIGLGNIEYAQYIADWEDRNKLTRALTFYEQALRALDHPPGAYVDEKVNIALGNIYVVAAQIDNDSALFLKAIDHYEEVTSKYTRTQDERIKDWAATAYFGIGAAYERQGNVADAIESYHQSQLLTEDENLRERITSQITSLEQLH